MKTNEAVYRSPKWLRNFVDWDVATGEDLKARKEARRKHEAEQERLRKEAERIAKEKERQKERDELQGRLFDDLIIGVMNFLPGNYRKIVKDVYVIPNTNDIVVEFGCSTPDYGNIEATIIFYPSKNPISYDIEFKCEKKYQGFNYFSYRVSGLMYAPISHIVHQVVMWWSDKNKGFERKYKGSKKSTSDDYGYYGENEPKTAKKAPRPNQQTERDPRANRLRRLALLRQTLEGYEATLAKTKKGTRDYETLSNEIETIKGRIRAMERNNEGFNHVMSFQIFEKQFTPNRGDYVTIIYALTGEPVPVKIEKVYPNNTYLVSFNVEGSTAKGAPDQTIKNSDIVAPYKPIRSPVGTGYISANTNMSIRQVHQVSNDMYL